MTALTRVLLADSHTIMRAGLRRILEESNEINVVAEAQSGEQAYKLFGELTPDVLVMELSMPKMGGLESLGRVKSRYPQANVIIISMDENVTYASHALAAGAMGYISKSSGADDLLKAVNAAAKGENYLSAIMAMQVALKNTSENDPMQKLSTREFEVFRLLAEGKTVEDIAKCLSVSQKTVANYQTLLKQKLEIHSPVDLVCLAVKHKIISI
ncbi:MAG: response regulator transcription factor [Methylophaga sp.]|nr:response regulator transcription factor [Methylophaga sp.]